jgi:HK97 gp10 family phage protein
MGVKSSGAFYTVEISGISQIMKKLDELSANVENGKRKAIQNGCAAIRDQAKLNAPKDTGALRNSIKYTASQDEGVVRVSSDYGVYVEFGTGPKGQADHAGIDPKARPSYAPKGWVYKGGDDSLHYTEGMPARPYLYPAVAEIKPQLPDIFKKAVMEAVNNGAT